MIQIAQPLIGEEEIAAVNEVMHSGMLAQGPKVAKLEADFAAYVGTAYAVAVNSGTAALHAALYAAGVGPGDEVITTPFSFIATINPILMLGAKPVLVDIEPDGCTIDASKIEAVITKKTKAIIPVHLYGQAGKMGQIQDIAKKHKLIVIEDACQSIGSEFRGVKTGNLGDFGCFSLYATKNIMCGEGGVITTNNEQFAIKMKQFRQHGMSAQYEYVDVGFNYRMTDLQAAIAIEQLKKVDAFNAARTKNAQVLHDGLGALDGLVLPSVHTDSTHVWHQFTVRISELFPKSRDDVVATLRSRGVNAGVYYPKPLHGYSHIQKLGYALGDFPVAEAAAREVVSLPVHPGLSDADLRCIIDEMRQTAHVQK